MMTSRQRLLAALEGKAPDRLPATTHHVMTSFLDTCPGGGTALDFFDRFGLDAVAWTVPCLPRSEAAAPRGAVQPDGSVLDPSALSTPEWRVEAEVTAEIPYRTTRYRITTPGGVLTTDSAGRRPLGSPADLTALLAGEPVTRIIRVSNRASYSVQHLRHPGAMAAVAQWRFAPATLKGVPVDVIVEVGVEFKLR